MSVKEIKGLSENGRKWIIASYILNAKTKIDSLSYFAKYHEKIPIGALSNIIYPTYLDFFIECCAAVDNHIELANIASSTGSISRKQLQTSYIEIEKIYYWRDKFAAHHDLDALGYGLCESFSSWKIHIEKLKNYLKVVMSVCKSSIPDMFTLEYVIHDPIAFRLVHRIDRLHEEKIYNMQHPLRSIYNNYDIFNKNTKNKDIHLINSVDDVCRYIRTKNVLARPNDIGVLLELGICMEETLQRLQEKIIIFNILYDENTWCLKGKTFEDKLLQKINNNIIKFGTS